MPWLTVELRFANRKDRRRVVDAVGRAAEHRRVPVDAAEDGCLEETGSVAEIESASAQTGHRGNTITKLLLKNVVTKKYYNSSLN